MLQIPKSITEFKLHIQVAEQALNQHKWIKLSQQDNKSGTISLDLSGKF